MGAGFGIGFLLHRQHFELARSGGPTSSNRAATDCIWIGCVGVACCLDGDFGIQCICWEKRGWHDVGIYQLTIRKGR